MQPSSTSSTSSRSESLKSRRYSAPPTNLPPSSPSPLSMTSSQTADSPSPLKHSGHRLRETMQQFCLKDSPLSDKEEEKQPSSQEISYLKPSRLHQSSLQSPSLQLSSPNTSSPQPTSLQVLRKPTSHLENHLSSLSPRDQMTSSNSLSPSSLPPSSLPVSSRFVSK